VSVPSRTTGSLLAALQESGALTPTALILPAGVSEDELFAIGRMFGQIKEMTTFGTGDSLIYVKDNFGDDTWVRYIEENGWNYHSCENIMSVCRNVRPPVRREELKFGHHDVVRALLPNEQKHFLALAVRNGWTRQRLRDEIHGPKPLPPAVNGSLPDVVRDAIAGARPLMDGWLISNDSYVRLCAALGEEHDA